MSLTMPYLVENAGQVTERVRAISEVAGDPEGAHVAEDWLWRMVLLSIAVGKVDDPAAVCEAALSTLDLDFERWYA